MGRLMEDIPHEIMEEILLGLPIKSVLRSKSVCKYWRDILSHPEFKKTHLRRRPRQPPLLYVTNFVDSKPLGYLLPSSSFSSWVRFDGYVLDSCDGLLWLVDEYHRFVLWNPSIRQHTRLPPSPNPILRQIPKTAFPEIVSGNRCRNNYFHGFGYDSCSDDYKIVETFVSFYTKSTRIDVFSLKLNAWRSSIIPGGKYHDFVNLHNKGVVCHGAVHWISSPSSSSGPKILGFDFEKEEFKEMGFPINTPVDKAASCCRLEVVEGHLCAYDSSESRHPPRKNYWVMKEYGVEASWTKMSTDTEDVDEGFSIWDFLNDKEEKVVILFDDIHDDQEISRKKDEDGEDIMGSYVKKIGMCNPHSFMETLVSPCSTTTQKSKPLMSKKKRVKTII